MLPSADDKKTPNFAFMGSCTLSEYVPSSFSFVSASAQVKQNAEANQNWVECTAKLVCQ